ncbi:hypothetical protein CT676_36960 [Bradyrhizobium sp. MOS001]|nr:hypothetical protein CT676_36960 [Bradyrhizobium sp. MOS001]
MPRVDRRIQYAAAPLRPRAVSGILDCPLSRAMTPKVWRRRTTKRKGAAISRAFVCLNRARLLRVFP